MPISISNKLTMAMFATAAVGAAQPSLAQDTLPPEIANGKPSDVPIAVQRLRWAMNDADVNALTFHSMDDLFTTRTVPRSGPVWHLPREDHALDFTYDFGGATYSPEQFLDRTYTNALLVMKEGKIVYENYRNNTGPDTRFIAWSMTKSLTSLMIGTALQEGRIASLDDTIDSYIPELKGGGYEGVTIRQIMQMRSGVDYEDRFDFANPSPGQLNHINALVKNAQRFTDPALTVSRASEPGTEFRYKTLDTAVLGWLLERVSAGSSIAAYMAQRLWEPLGAERDGFFIMDGPPGVGREFNGAGLNAALRDFARVGQMMLDQGRANGRQIVPAEWIALTTAPAVPEAEGTMGYGYQWWTLDGGSYSAIGLQGQYIFVDPRSRTVVVKLSYFPPLDDQADEETRAFLKAVSAWSPGEQN